MIEADKHLAGVGRAVGIRFDDLTVAARQWPPPVFCASASSPVRWVERAANFGELFQLLSEILVEGFRGALLLLKRSDDTEL